MGSGKVKGGALDVGGRRSDEELVLAFVEAMGGEEGNQSQAARESNIGQSTLSRWVGWVKSLDNDDADCEPPTVSDKVRTKAERYLRRRERPDLEVQALDIAADYLEEAAGRFREMALDVIDRALAVTEDEADDEVQRRIRAYAENAKRAQPRHREQSGSQRAIGE